MSDKHKKDITIQDFTLIVAPDSAPTPGDERIHQLLVTEGAEQGRMIELTADSITVGRAPPADVTLRDVEISRSHCRISQDAGVLMIADLKSTNGTFVDGRRIAAPVKLTDGCIIRIGRHQLKYERRTRREIELSRDFERSLEGASRYVQSMLLFEAIARASDAGTLKTGGLQIELRKSDRETLIGRVKFDEKGDNPFFSHRMGQHQSGKIAVVWPKDSATGKMNFPAVPW